MDEIVQFLARIIPWGCLDEARLRAVVSTLLVEYYPRGSCILDTGGAPPEFLSIIRVGEVDLWRPGEGGTQLADRLGEGESFDVGATAAGSPPSSRAVAREDCLIYLLPRAELLRLLEVPEIHRFCLGSPGDRLRARLARPGPLPLEDPFGGTVAEVIARPLVRCAPGASIAAAACLMRDSAVSSVIVDADPPGIVTDRDLRSRVIAAGLASSSPVSEIMSRPLLTFPAEGTLLEALLLMLDRDVHHLGVRRAGQIIGVITSSDLLRRYTRGPLRLPRLVSADTPLEAFDRYPHELDAVLAALWHRGIGAGAINKAISLTHDVVVRRLLVNAQRALGGPPAPFALLALGCYGRMEVALRRDHCGALIYEDLDAAGGAEYVAALARIVSQQLSACGFSPRPLTAAAAPGVLCLPLAGWLGEVSGWASGGGQAGWRLARIVDARQVAGSLEVLAATRSLICQAGAAEIFRVRALGVSAGAAAPIAVMQRHLLEADGTLREALDLDERVARPLADLARFFAVEAGDATTTTAERLRGAGARQIIEPPLADALAAADEWLGALRLRRRIQREAAGASSPDMLLIAELDGADRTALRDTFAAIRAARGSIAGRLPPPVARGSWT